MNKIHNNIGLKNNILKVNLKRGFCIESVHYVHAAVCDIKGRVLMKAGDKDYETFIRSSLKPFQAIPFLSSGTAEKYKCGEKSIAIACGSHSGEPKHAREAYKILWNSHVEIENLKCPLPINKTSNLEHNCSGKHSAFLATCKKMNWPLEGYLDVKHPLQVEIFRCIAGLLGLPAEELISETDNCGAPTLLLRLSQMAVLYAHLSNSDDPVLEQIRRAIINNAQLVAGEGRFDTDVMNRSHGQLISKGGSEGIQCIGRIGEGIGLSIKAEDGSKRAKQAAAIHLLKQLEWITPTGLKEMEEIFSKLSPGVNLEVEGELRFNE